MKSIALLLLLGLVNAGDISLLQSDMELSTDSESEAGKLGSLEQAFLEQKLKKYQRGIEMIGLNQKEYDTDTLKLIDVNEYNKDVQSSLEDVELNIEIPNKPHAASKQVMAQVAVADAKDTATYNEKLGTQYKDNNHKGQALVRTNLDVVEMGQMLKEQEKQLEENQKKQEKVLKAKEANLHKLAQIKKTKENKSMADVIKMDKEWDMFCRTFDMKHFHNAMEKWVEIDQEGVLPVELLKVNTKQILQKEGFSFPEVIQNQYAQDQLNELGAAQ